MLGTWRNAIIIRCSSSVTARRRGSIGTGRRVAIGIHGGCVAKGRHQRRTSKETGEIGNRRERDRQ
eukprot:9238792-Pyramimonas_sp.AAC.1